MSQFLVTKISARGVIVANTITVHDEERMGPSCCLNTVGYNPGRDLGARVETLTDLGWTTIYQDGCFNS